MSTNFYAHFYEKIRCPHCDKEHYEETPYEKVHIGKSSAGWRFLFRLYKQKYSSSSEKNILIYDTDDPKFGMGTVKGILDKLTQEDVRIFDEYTREHEFINFISMINKMQKLKPRSTGDYDVSFSEFS